MLIQHELNLTDVRDELAEAQKAIHIPTSSIRTISWINDAGSIDELPSCHRQL
ncbi:hypothetical protein NTGM5_120076 [Candidatus Nitrotoga sp. M5]|nr:hypothetical protein NTGM5_120076 [Candidatus Nitrotoga sp. M5]